MGVVAELAQKHVATPHPVLLPQGEKGRRCSGHALPPLPLRERAGVRGNSACRMTHALAIGGITPPSPDRNPASALLRAASGSSCASAHCPSGNRCREPPPHPTAACTVARSRLSRCCPNQSPSCPPNWEADFR